MTTTNKLISEELREKIKSAVKSRQSLEILLKEEGFVGTRDSIHEFIQILLEIMGNKMALEFIFSSHIAIWDEYRKLIDEELWRHIAKEGAFESEHYLLLGTSLIHRDETKMGTDFLRDAAQCSFDVKSYMQVAEAIHVHLKDNEWAEEVLLMAKEHCSDAEHYAHIAEAMMNIAEDREMSIKLFQEGLEKVTIAHEYMEIATSIVRTLSDCKWAKEVFEMHKKVPQSGTPIELLAEEAFQDEFKEYCK